MQELPDALVFAGRRRRRGFLLFAGTGAPGELGKGAQSIGMEGQEPLARLLADGAPRTDVMGGLEARQRGGAVARLVKPFARLIEAARFFRATGLELLEQHLRCQLRARLVDDAAGPLLSNIRARAPRIVLEAINADLARRLEQTLLPPLARRLRPALDLDV